MEALQINPFAIVTPINVVRFKAIAFPAGIMAAYEKIDEVVPDVTKRKHYGFSQPNSKGEIEYWAGVEQLPSDNGNYFGLEPFTIVTGNYQSILVKDFKSNPFLLRQAFKTLTALPEIDPNGYCLEMMLSQTDVLCLVRVLQ